MIGRLGGQPVAAVVFAAGEWAVGADRQEYQLTIVGRVRALCPGALVEWPAGPRRGGHWGAAYYLPIEEEIGFFESQPGGFAGLGHRDPAGGIGVEAYL